MTMMTATDLEALATECRSSAYRQSLADSDVWLRVDVALGASVDALKGNFGVNNSGDTTSSGPHTSALEGAAAVATTNDSAVDDDEDDGLGYTIRMSRNQVLSGLDAGEFAPASVKARDVAEASRHVAIVTSAFRFLRNACVACSANQSACSTTNAIALAHAVVLGSCQWVDVNDDDIKPAVVLLAQVALQFLVNCVTGHARNQATVWTLFFPDHFQKVLVECQEHRKIVAFAVALMLNCVNATTENNLDVAMRRVDLVCARNLMITVLQRCLVKPAAGAASSTAVATLAANTIDEHDPAFEWICLLFGVLFDAHLAKDVYNAVGAHMLSKLWSRVTPEQLILLRMLTLWVTSRAGEGVHTQPPSMTATKTAVPVDGAVASLALFEFLQSTWVYVITASDDDRPEEAEDERKRVWIELENEAKLLLLDALGVVTQIAPLVATTAAQTLLLSLLDELHRVWQQRRLGVPSAQATNAARTPMPQDLSAAAAREPFGYRSGMIRAIGNLSFRHSEHQDLVRERGRLELFLNHCNIDDMNPFVREWSLVALRNLCEGNEANQQYINALKPQSMDPAAGSQPSTDTTTPPSVPPQ